MAPLSLVLLLLLLLELLLELGESGGDGGCDGKPCECCSDGDKSRDPCDDDDGVLGDGGAGEEPSGEFSN